MEYKVASKIACQWGVIHAESDVEIDYDSFHLSVGTVFGQSIAQPNA